MLVFYWNLFWHDSEQTLQTHRRFPSRDPDWRIFSFQFFFLSASLSGFNLLIAVISSVRQKRLFSLFDTSVRADDRFSGLKPQQLSAEKIKQHLLHSGFVTVLQINVTVYTRTVGVATLFVKIKKILADILWYFWNFKHRR